MKAFSALVLILGALTCVSASAIAEQQRDGSVQYMNRQQAELASIQSVDNMQKMDKGFKLDMGNSASLLQSQSDSSDSMSTFSHGVGHGPQNREPFSRLSINENNPIGVYSFHGEMNPASLVGQSNDVSVDNMGIYGDESGSIMAKMADKNVQRGQINTSIKIIITMVEPSESNLESSLGDDDSHGTRMMSKYDSNGFQLSPDSNNMKPMGSFQGFEPARSMLESSGMS